MLAVVAVAVVASATVGWAAWSAAEARSEIDALPRWLHCNGVDMPFEIVNGGEWDGDESDSFEVPVPAFVISSEAIKQRDTICQLTLTIVNRGSRTVDIKSVAFPMLGVGESSGFPLELGENGADFPASNPDDPLSRAIVDVNGSLDGGESMDVLVDLRPRPGVPRASDEGYSAISSVARDQGGIPRIHGDV